MEKDDRKSYDDNEAGTILALINSVLEKLSNIVKKSSNAQQDVEKVKNDFLLLLVSRMKEPLPAIKISSHYKEGIFMPIHNFI